MNVPNKKLFELKKIKNTENRYVKRDEKPNSNQDLKFTKDRKFY